MNNQPERKFNLLTTVAMIIGIVIGSGIFFKTPEIIQHTQGNVLMGILAFIFAGFGIIFGSLTIASYAQEDDSTGGLVSYCELSWGKNVGFLAGWFQTVVYFPAITAIVSWVSANYTLALFGFDNLLTTRTFNLAVWPITIFYLFFLYGLNLMHTKQAGKLQSFSMVVKILALLTLAFVGIVFGNPTPLISNAKSFPVGTTSFFGALIAVAFATDGWMLAPSIAHEIKDPKKNLTKALIFAPTAIIAIYLVYFYGAVSFVGPEAILSGTDPITSISIFLFGSMGPKIIFTFVIISVLGTLNGLILAYIRAPYALALRNEIPGSNLFKKVSSRYDTPINSGILSLIISLIYLLLHFLSLDANFFYNFSFFNGLEVDALPIVLNYFFLVLMYLGVLLRPTKFSSLSWAQQYLYPTLAILGSAIIIFGGITKPQFNVYLLVCFALIIIGLLIRPKKNV